MMDNNIHATVQKDSAVRSGHADIPPHTPHWYASRGRFFGTPLRAISRFIHQNTQTTPSPTRGEGGWEDEGHGCAGVPARIAAPRVRGCLTRMRVPAGQPSYTSLYYKATRR